MTCPVNPAQVIDAVDDEYVDFKWIAGPKEGEDEMCSVDDFKSVFDKVVEEASADSDEEFDDDSEKASVEADEASDEAAVAKVGEEASADSEEFAASMAASDGLIV